MTLPAPGAPVFVAGAAPQVSDMTSLVTTPFTFCSVGVAARLEQRTVQAIAATTLTVISFDTVLEDPYSGWNAGSNSWLAPFSGYFEVTLTVGTAAVNGTVAASVVVTGNQYTMGEIATPSTNEGNATCSFIVPMIAGFDFIQGEVFATSAVNTSTNVGLRSCMEIRFVSM